MPDQVPPIPPGPPGPSPEELEEQRRRREARERRRVAAEERRVRFAGTIANEINSRRLPWYKEPVNVSLVIILVGIVTVGWLVLKAMETGAATTSLVENLPKAIARELGKEPNPTPTVAEKAGSAAGPTGPTAPSTSTKPAAPPNDLESAFKQAADAMNQNITGLRQDLSKASQKVDERFKKIEGRTENLEGDMKRIQEGFRKLGETPPKPAASATSATLTPSTGAVAVTVTLGPQ